MTFDYRPASADDLETIWAKNIADNPGNDRWIGWKYSMMDNQAAGRSVSFVAAVDGDPIGEGTLILSPDCKAISGRIQLCDRTSVANINALRIQRAYEGQGHISKLVKLMESYAKRAGFSYLSIGVEARETRTLSIYLHWGYRELVHFEEEDGVLVLYYRKKL